MVRSAVLLSSSLPSLDLFDLTLSTFSPSTTINDIWLFKVVYCNTFMVFVINVKKRLLVLFFAIIFITLIKFLF